MVLRLHSYPNPLKRKGAAVDTDAPTKSARITLMKQLAKKYKKSKINSIPWYLLWNANGNN